jgi:ubiquinone/menaquinone biosynthesis C-methylase UbiE
MKRRPMRELLDEDLGTPREIAASLRDLRWFNRWFGGLSTTRRLLESVQRLTGRTRFTLLEVACGDGYLMRTIANQLGGDGIQLDVTLLDRAASHLPGNGSMPKVSADALSLPFRESAFDLVSCSLFLHHLPPDQAKEFAHEALRVCRMAVLVHDLVRHPVHLALAYAGIPLYRSRITRNDAPASVWQAYTVPEITNCFHEAGAAEVSVTQQYLYRMGVIAQKPPK